VQQHPPRPPISPLRCSCRRSLPLIKYLGSKRLLIPAILDAVRAACPSGTSELPGTESSSTDTPHPRSTSSSQHFDTPVPPLTILDLFSGTSRVSHALKAAGYRVLANDHTAFAHTLALGYIQADADLLPQASHLIDHLNTVAQSASASSTPDYFTHTFCHRSRYFHPDNGPRITAVRNEIARLAPALGPELESVLLVALLHAADRVDSTTGVQMAYLKEYAPRAYNTLHLRTPRLLPRPAAGPCLASCMDALDAARQLSADIAYLDPPYNQHSYLRNYHVWETLVRWDAPEHYGRACKRLDCRTRGSPFNSRRQIHSAMAQLIAAVQARTLIVSFNNEGYISRDEMEQLLSTRGRVRVGENDHLHHIPAQIGIYNPRGEKVGRISHLRNKEYLYIVQCA
jgi:adenine-specific DNA-methyltransferase